MHLAAVLVHPFTKACAFQVAMNKDAIKWRKKRRAPLKAAASRTATAKPKKKEPNAAHMMTSVMPQIQSTCGMGTFSQKKVDEEFMKYLFPYPDAEDAEFDEDSGDG